MLHVLRQSLPNVYLITGERAILVDSGGPKDVPGILAFLKQNHVEVGNLALIVLTHGHWDHAGGAAQLRSATGAPVAIHRADAALVRSGTNGRLHGTNLTGRLLRPLLDKSYPPFEPDVLIDDEIHLESYGVSARILLTPGHTPGSISVRTDAGEIVVGDLLMGGWVGGWLFPTWPGLHYYADDLGQLHASIRKVLAATPTVIHPGHGGPLNPSAVAARFNSLTPEQRPGP